MKPMKTYRAIGLLAIIFSACSAFSNQPGEAEMVLTPYVTATPAGQATATFTPEPLPTAEPTMTPTPFVHVLGANETIYSLAYTYNLSVNEILSINPQITPRALSVGTQILIPYIGTPETEKSAIESVISAPMALTVSPVKCSGTAEGGLWCVAAVENQLAETATGITLTFTLKDASGQTISEQSVPPLLNLLVQGGKLPVAAYFNPEIPVDYQVQVDLKTALPVKEGSVLAAPLEIKVNSIDPAGRSALISAVIPAQSADSKVESVWVGLVAYDETGNIVGIRRLEYPAVTGGEQGQAIKVFVYSNSADIAKVDVLGEAQIKKNED